MLIVQNSMKLSLLITLLLGLLATDMRAQVVADTARGLVGGKVRLVLRDPAGTVGRPGSATLTATMQLSNPTVFYPERFSAPAGDSVVSYTLKALKDSIYQIAVTIRREANSAAGDTLCYLDGEALAGSDSVCRVSIFNVALADQSLPDISAAIITRSIGPPLPYVRFAILEQNYPNPVPRGASTTWAYRIDKRSDVRFHFYNPLGEELFVAHLGDQDIGPHTYVLTPALDMPTGAYLVRLVTNSGSADKLMMILR
jgi:hypothetical protein